MNVDIQTQYFAQNEFGITVRVDGRIEAGYPATALTVVKRRNKLIDAYSRTADTVTANGIPDAFDIAGAHGRFEPLDA